MPNNSQGTTGRPNDDNVYCFQNPNQLAGVKQQFYAIRNFPNVFGAIDCTHKLHPPVVMMLGDSSTEKVHIPLMSKLPVMPKGR